MTSRLFIEIDVLRHGKMVTTLYRLTQHQPDRRVAVKAWRLMTEDGEIRDVAVCRRGYVSCTCHDFVFRKGNSPDPCKHALALSALGLLPEMP